MTTDIQRAIDLSETLHAGRGQRTRQASLFGGGT
jgi:hypothetical protein